jgi:hypothetical protein
LVKAGVLHEPSPLVLRVGAVTEPELQNFVDAFHPRLSSRGKPPCDDRIDRPITDRPDRNANLFGVQTRLCLRLSVDVPPLVMYVCAYARALGGV